jgi:hypothetical protein
MPDPAVLVRVADAIAAELATAQQAGAFVDLESFVPERSYADWESDVEALNGLHVDVVPTAYEGNELGSRGAIHYLCSVDVGVRRWFSRVQSETATGRIKTSEIDRLVLFVQELNEFFLSRGVGRRLATYEEAVWRQTKIRATYSRKHLRDHRMFLGILRPTYLVSQPA